MCEPEKRAVQHQCSWRAWRRKRSRWKLYAFSPNTGSRCLRRPVEGLEIARRSRPHRAARPWTAARHPDRGWASRGPARQGAPLSLADEMQQRLMLGRGAMRHRLMALASAAVHSNKKTVIYRPTRAARSPATGSPPRGDYQANGEGGGTVAWPVRLGTGFESRPPLGIFAWRSGSICCGPFLPWVGIWKRCQMFTANCSAAIAHLTNTRSQGMTGCIDLVRNPSTGAGLKIAAMAEGTTRPNPEARSSRSKQ
jgi:hypothetical protein